MGFVPKFSFRKQEISLNFSTYKSSYSMFKSLMKFTLKSKVPSLEKEALTRNDITPHQILDIRGDLMETQTMEVKISFWLCVYSCAMALQFSFGCSL